MKKKKISWGMQHQGLQAGTLVTAGKKATGTTKSIANVNSSRDVCNSRNISNCMEIRNSTEIGGIASTVWSDFNRRDPRKSSVV
jgi:hypothetical protein